jgi:pilus assembly protein TadC
MNHEPSRWETFTMLMGAAAVPRSERTSIIRRLQLAKLDAHPYLLYGVTMYAMSALAFVAAIIASLMFAGVTSPVATVLLAVFFLILFMGVGVLLTRLVLRLIIDTRIAYRVQAMEEELPDFLAELSLNLKSGLSLHQSIARASAEDFGELSEAMRHVATKVRLGYGLEEALRDFIEGYPGDQLRDTFELILISWRKGASTPKLIDRMVSNMKVMRNLREKISASVANYRIFLATITVLVAPAMMALSFHVIDLIRSITTEVMLVTSSATLPFSVQAVQFDDVHFMWFSALTLVVIATFISLIITYIEKGSLNGGRKQLFIYIATSLGSYFFFMMLFTVFFRLFQV